MNSQFPAITMRMHFFTFYMHMYAYFGVRSVSIGVNFVLDINRCLFVDKFICLKHFSYAMLGNNFDREK